MSWNGALNVDLNDYCLSIDLHKSMFFIDILKDTYDFTIKDEEISIFKKLSSGISEKITRKELIYYIQVEMINQLCEFVDFGNKKPLTRDALEHQCFLSRTNSVGKYKHIQMFYCLFNTIDSINKTIDNMIYLIESTDENGYCQYHQPK